MSFILLLLLLLGLLQDAGQVEVFVDLIHWDDFVKLLVSNDSALFQKIDDFLFLAFQFFEQDLDFLNVSDFLLVIVKAIVQAISVILELMWLDALGGCGLDLWDITHHDLVDRGFNLLLFVLIRNLLRSNLTTIIE